MYDPSLAQRIEAPVYLREQLPPGARVEGPALITEDQTTTVVSSRYDAQIDPQGFILTGRDLMTEGRRPKGWTAPRDPFPFETSVPGIFAAGDARAGSGKRVAAAVGEGSATVGMIHQYLATV